MYGAKPPLIVEVNDTGSGNIPEVGSAEIVKESVGDDTVIIEFDDFTFGVGEESWTVSVAVKVPGVL